MTKININNQSGFTLLEVLIALFIFSIGILGVNAMQLTSIQGNSKAQRLSEASNAAADQIESFLSLAYDAAALNDIDGDGTGQDVDQDGVDDDVGNFGLDDVTAATADGNGMSTDGNYQLFWNIAIDHPGPGSKTIRIFVDRPRHIQRFSMEIIKVDI